MSCPANISCLRISVNIQQKITRDPFQSTEIVSRIFLVLIRFFLFFSIIFNDIIDHSHRFYSSRSFFSAILYFSITHFFLSFDDTGINSDDYELVLVSSSFFLSRTVYASTVELRFSFRFFLNSPTHHNTFVNYAKSLEQTEAPRAKEKVI